jgi:hypothetical protein
VPIVSTNDLADQGADLAVWSDDLAPWIGLPLLVQLKAHPAGPSDLSAAASRAADALAGPGMLWGLLLYHGSPIDPAKIQAPPNVLPLQAKAFLEELRETGFGDLVRRLRNQQVHGGFEMPQYSKAKI